MNVNTTVSSQSSDVSPRRESKGVYIFDFDGTITTDDTFALFLKYFAGPFGWAWRIALLLPTFITYKLGMITRDEVKIRVIRRFFKGVPMDSIDSKAKKFAHTVIPGLIRPAAQLRLDELKKDPESLYICSASITPYLKHWCETQGITNIMATELEQSNDIATGEILGWNIWGPGKLRRIKSEFFGQDVQILEVYGDTRGDLEMLDAAEASYWNPFRLILT